MAQKLIPFSAPQGKLKLIMNNKVIIVDEPQFLNPTSINEDFARLGVDNAAWSPEMDEDVNPHKYKDEEFEVAANTFVMSLAQGLRDQAAYDRCIRAYKAGWKAKGEQSSNEAIEFAKWISENLWTGTVSGNWYKQNKLTSTESLYKLFKQHKQSLKK